MPDISETSFYLLRISPWCRKTFTNWSYTCWSPLFLQMPSHITATDHLHRPFSLFWTFENSRSIDIGYSFNQGKWFGNVPFYEAQLKGTHCFHQNQIENPSLEEVHSKLKVAMICLKQYVDQSSVRPRRNAYPCILNSQSEDMIDTCYSGSVSYKIKGHCLCKI